MESETLDSDTADRPRGILSEADRKYLIATEQEREDNYSRQAQNLREREIRKRLRHGLLDLDLILRSLDPDVLEEVFSRELVESEGILSLQRGLAGAIGLPYYIAHRKFVAGDADELFESMVEKGVWSAKNMIDGPEGPPAFLQYSVHFEVSSPTIDVDMIAEKVRDGDFDALSETELRTFLWAYETFDSTPVTGDEAATKFLTFAEDRLPENFLTE